MKLVSFVVTPYLISGRKLKGVIRLRAYQNIEYHRYHDDIILFIGTQNRGSGSSVVNAEVKSFVFFSHTDNWRTVGGRRLLDGSPQSIVVEELLRSSFELGLHL